ncbi:CYTH domain-containing protein [Methanolobus zinderi]|uniref:CYTH domain-containing protein n=1 Tax=Methanolobus zinderi TaxID=536044 RepID=A0A7D5INR3_9EURY|nr:CYTH domain-containing protein [Methanolobus zinderi]QLC49467.1 CYTH domain-containing protein [Methanolobus zinderi]
MMEIEAKFLLSDEVVFEKLSSIDSIDTFTVANRIKSNFKDTYFDTLDMALYSAGYSFRCREKPGKITYTLKSLEKTDSVIRKREEIEVVVPEKCEVSELDEGRLKSFVLNVIGSGKLFSLFEVIHERTSCDLMDDSRNVAELSLDDVVIKCKGNEKAYLEVEVELQEGSEDELQSLAEVMVGDFGLMPGSSSKFDNGLELWRENISRTAGKLDYGKVPSRKKIDPITFTELLNDYDVERNHARKVTENSLALFDELISVHRLDPDLRDTMIMAALVHDVGVTTDVKGHHKAGRDILLRQSPAEIPFPLYLILPWTTFLHKKKIHEDKLAKLFVKKKFSALPQKMRDDILRMAAILRIADGMDYSRMDSVISNIETRNKDVIIEIKGPGSEIDARRAEKKSDLWGLVLDRAVKFRPVA